MLRHRVIVSFEAEATGVTADDVIDACRWLQLHRRWIPDAERYCEATVEDPTRVPGLIQLRHASKEIPALSINKSQNPSSGMLTSNFKGRGTTLLRCDNTSRGRRTYHRLARHRTN